LHDELAQHFDATMEKIGRWYRHWAQLIALVLAIVFTVYVNANTLDLLHQLTSHPETRLELARIQSTLSPGDTDHADASKNLEAAEKIIVNDTLDDAAHRPNWLHALVGLLITILAVSLGAPFWFDVLGRISPRATGADRPPSSVSVQPAPAGTSVSQGSNKPV
jgi:hypothetical protein